MECRIGVIGCGGFGLYAMEQYASIAGVKIVSATDPNDRAVDQAVQRFGVIPQPDVNSLCQRPDVDLVYIASPPFLHHGHSLAALNADKHVVVEKPLALSLDEADHLLRLAHTKDRIVVANLIQRYNPLADKVGALIEEELIGKPLHGYFENYASDEQLGVDHWFWDTTKSGGIFIEHGVHFFDLFASWLGDGEVVAAQRTLREPMFLEDQVQCSIRYRDDVLVNFYHGFHQPGRLDRQELRIVFERGDVTLHGWIPTQLCLDAVVNTEDEQRLTELFPNADVGAVETYTGQHRHCRGRHKDFEVDHRIRLSVGTQQDKMSRYGKLVKSLMEDQIKRIRNACHRRRITESASRESLRMAVQANDLARKAVATNTSEFA